MIKNFKIFSESIFWYDSGKLVKDDNFELPERKYYPAEQWLLDQITDLEEVKLNEYAESIYYKKNDRILFEYDEEYRDFWCHYRKIWSVLGKKFGLNYKEISELIKSMVEERLNLRSVTTLYLPSGSVWGWKNI